MDDEPKFIWDLNIIDEDDLPEEDHRYRRVYDIDTDFVILEEVDDDDEPPVYHEEELDENMMYTYYEESEFY